VAKAGPESGFSLYGGSRRFDGTHEFSPVAARIGFRKYLKKRKLEKLFRFFAVFSGKGLAQQEGYTVNGCELGGDGWS
jgi:hypothetical protein